MAMNKQKYSLSETFSSIASGITSVYVFIILAIFPLYTHDKYFDILGARYIFFKIWGISLAIILAFLGIVYLISDSKNSVTSETAIRRLLNSFKPKNIRKHFLITDFFFIAMLIVAIISTIGSEFKEEAFYGNAGRYQGLECWIIYFITYVSISRTYKFKKWHLDFAILACAFASIWGALDFFRLDPFGFFVNVNEVQQTMFASSIGNLNTFTNYTIMGFALASALFIKEKNLIKTIFYALTAIICCAGCIYGLADNAVLGIFALYLFLPFLSLKSRRDLIRYIWVIDFLLISFLIFYISMKAPNWNMYQGSFFQSLLSYKIFAFIFIPFTIFAIILNYILYRLKPNYGANISSNLNPMDSILPKQIKIIYIIIVIIGFAFVTYILLDVNIYKQHLDIWNKIPASYQLTFNDDWGTHRGHNWRIAFTNFTENFNIFKKLFGYGPDTYLIVSERTFYQEMVQRYGEVYDSAHNEYINYLICEGALGLISYLGIFISGIIYGIKNLKTNVLILAPIMAVLCYMIQAIVNIAIPITTPIFFTLMYICVASYIENRKNNES